MAYVKPITVEEVHKIEKESGAEQAYNIYFSMVRIVLTEITMIITEFLQAWIRNRSQN